MTGIRLVQRLTASRPMVITLQLGTEDVDNLSINKGSGGSEGLKCDPLKKHRPGKFKETGSRVLLPPHSLIPREKKFRFLLALAVIYTLFVQS